MSRLPIRLRLTAVFVAVMGAVLLVIGLFLYSRTDHELDAAINASLRARLGALADVADRAHGDPRTVIPAGERFAQLLSVDGRLLASHPAGDAPALRPAEAARAARGAITVERHERFRYAAGPAMLDGHRVVAVAGTSLADRERALESLGGALLVGLPLALLLAAGIAYATAAGALAPVEAIRRRAEGIIRADPDARVPVPGAEDEIRRLALTLDDMLQRLARSAEHERAFVANASHELRTPLTALRAEIDLALRHATSAADLRAALERCRDDTRRLVALADDLLALARADAGAAGERRATALDALLDEVAAQVRHEAGAQGRQVVVVRGGVTAAVDGVALTRAMRNLADNALAHGRGRVTLAARREDGAVVIAVDDEGALEDPGLPDRAFDRFVRGRDATSRPGAGLGLSLVQAIAAEHGGEARLEALPGGGTRASMRLPDA